MGRVVDIEQILILFSAFAIVHVYEYQTDDGIEFGKISSETQITHHDYVGSVDILPG